MTDTAIASTNEAAINFYDELGLSRDDTVERIQEALRMQKPSQQSRATRAGEAGDKARETLRLIALAEAAFSNDDAREAYDLSLRRKPDALATEEVAIDWLRRAWSYYFVEDFGAAGVAARKAREQEPNDALPYVIASWVNLAEADLRRAKEFADEAFVLDDLGEDSADVQHVRGVVFYSQSSFDRAIQSFDRAFAKAGDYEKADLLRRKSWAFEYQKQGEDALRCGLEGLAILNTIDGAAGMLLVENLTDIVCRSVDYLAGTMSYPGTAKSENAPAPRQVVDAYRSFQIQVDKAAIPSSSSATVKKHISDRVAVEELRLKAAELERVEDADGGQPGLPLIPAGAGLFCLLLGSAWSGFYLIGLALVGWAVYSFMNRSKWTEKRQAYATAQRELEDTHANFNRKRGAIKVDPTPPPMGRN